MTHKNLAVKEMGSVNKRMTDLKLLLRTLGRNTEVAVLTGWLCKIYANLI